MRLKNKYAVVTGSAMGMGKAVAEMLAAEGATVAVTDLDEKLAQQTAEGIVQKGGKAEVWTLDVTNRAEIKTVTAGIIGRFGRIDIWVNNAGISTMTPFLDLTEREWDNMHNVNGSGVFFCSQEVAKHMVSRPGGGKIVNNASMAGKRGGNARIRHVGVDAGGGLDEHRRVVGTDIGRHHPRLSERRDVLQGDGLAGEGRAWRAVDTHRGLALRDDVQIARDLIDE